MTIPTPSFRRVTVTRVTTLECAVCTNGWHFGGSPTGRYHGHYFARGAEPSKFILLINQQFFCENEEDNLMGIINESSLTTERDRELFKIRLKTFLDFYLSTAPREQLEAIEREMLSYRPTADHRK